MGASVLSSGGLGMRFGCGMKMIKDRNSRSKFSVDVGGREFLHFGPNAESASHHFHKQIPSPEIRLAWKSPWPKNLTIPVRTQIKPPWTNFFDFLLKFL